MTTRRPRSSLHSAKKYGFTLEEASNRRCEEMAAACGVTKSAFVQWFLDHAEITDHGVAMPHDVVLPLKKDEELPIKSA